jgi:DNA-binding transcriptional LysR family regulator
MSQADIDWELCRSFLAVFREGNLSRAARALRLTQPTLGRHIDEIERVLGVVLFTRSPQGLTPTDAAFDLRPHAQAMAAAAEALVRAASGSSKEARGTVRITVPEWIGVEVLPPSLASFHARYPGIIFELALTNRTEDLLRREADIGVRMVQSTQAALVTRRVGDIRFVLHAHRAYLDRHGTPESKEALRDHALIGFDKAMTWIQALRDSGTPMVREALSFRSDSPLAQFAAIRAGFGIGGCPLQIALRHPDLMPVLADKFSVNVGLWVAMHEDQRENRRVRLVFDHLVSVLGDFAHPGRNVPTGATIGEKEPAGARSKSPRRLLRET